MFLNVGSIMFNMNLENHGGTPSWGTELGQGIEYKYSVDDIGEIMSGMVYSKVSVNDKVWCPLGKGGNRQADYEYVVSSLFKKVYFNNILIKDANFLLLIVKQIKNPTGHHIGRQSIKYSPKIKLNDQEINQDCFNKIIEQLNMNSNSAWFINELKIKNQDELHFIGYICDEDNQMIFKDNNERHKYIDNLTNNIKPNCLPVLEPRINKIYPFNIILYGAPGTGKTYSTADYAVSIIENKTLGNEKRAKIMEKYKKFREKGQVVFTTFHQSYGYEDFIQGLRPINVNGIVEFKTIDGIFKKISDQAMMNPKDNFVLIIDEINRANMSKVFGELITLIESDKRWGEENELSITLPSGDRFAVPNNVYIIGTMNTADKSISMIDVALRRRFSFIEKNVDLETILDSKLRDILRKINQTLKKDLQSSDLLIGHAYFIGKNINDLDEIFNNQIIPLLYEYYLDNENKVKNLLDSVLLGTNIKVNNSSLGRINVIKEK